MVLIDNGIDMMSKWNRHKIELKFGNHRNIALQKESQVLQKMAVEELNINEADIYILKVKLPYPPKIKRSVLLIKRLIENGNLKIVINESSPKTHKIKKVSFGNIFIFLN
ncbi:MAG: hypothetical protein L3J11_04015 [Draconibacterium sp.]|nr:hypothetical protein [Draconibacterium sp.]